MKIGNALILLGLLEVPPQAIAHHTVANTVDISKAVALTGVITSVAWKSPHAVYHLQAPDASGTRIDWEIESRHLQGMRDHGIQMDTIKVGDRLTMNVMVAKDGSHHAATISVVLPGGRTVRLCTVTNDACP
jgi:hypothetical protein